MNFPSEFHGHQKEPDFTLLYIGGNRNRAGEFFEKQPIHSRYWAAEAEEGHNLCTAQSLWVRRSGYLLVVVDVESSESEWTLLEEFKWRKRVVFLVRREGVFQFDQKTRARLLSNGVVYAGNDEECALAIKEMVGGNSSSFPNLHLAAPMNSSMWLRSLRHDYLNLFLSIKDQLEAASLLEAQLEIDLLQDTLRNLFAFPLENSPGRALKNLRVSTETIISRTKRRPCQFLIPSSLRESLPAHWDLGDEYVLYDDQASARDLLANKEDHGIIHIAVTESEQICDELAHFFVEQLPAFVIVEASTSRSWKQWQTLASHHILGCYSQNDLLQGDDHLLAMKSIFFKLGGLYSLAGMFSRIEDLLLQTIRGLDKEFAEKVSTYFYSLWAAVHNAGLLFLGQHYMNWKKGENHE